MELNQNSSLISASSQQYQKPIIITVDESWLGKTIELNPQLLICPICYCIPLDFPEQCQNCQRVFCKKDFIKVIETDNRCPICKVQPWIKKNQIHIAYKQMFNALKLRCKHCQTQKEMTKDQLIQHLQLHNMYLSEESVLYDYTFISQNGVELKLNLTQNLEINVRKTMRCPKFQIAGSSGRVLFIDMNAMIAEHSTLGSCKIVQTKSKMLKKKKEYLIWTVNIADQAQIHQGKERFVFYSEQLQNIIQKNYQDFIRNQRLNQFCLDVRQSRFRISFLQMTQTNTFTKIVKPILRIPIILK